MVVNSRDEPACVVVREADDGEANRILFLREQAAGNCDQCQEQEEKLHVEGIAPYAKEAKGKNFTVFFTISLPREGVTSLHQLCISSKCRGDSKAGPPTT